MKTYLTLVLLSSLFFQAGAQNTSTTSYTYPDFPNEPILNRLENDGKALITTMWYTVRRPVHWKSRDWKRFGILAGATLGTMLLLDRPLARAADKYESEDFEQLARTTFNRFGAPAEHLIFATSLYVPGVVFKSGWLRNTGVLLLSSIGVSGVFQTFMKTASGRRRPSVTTDYDPFEFRPLRGGSSYHSFPSGHAVTGITTTYTLARQVPWLGAKIFFYALGGTIAVSRVYIGAHYTSDILFSTVMSIAVVEANIRYLSTRRKVEAVAGKPSFFMRPNGAGLALGYKW